MIFEQSGDFQVNISCNYAYITEGCGMIITVQITHLIKQDVTYYLEHVCLLFELRDRITQIAMI